MRQQEKYFTYDSGVRDYFLLHLVVLAWGLTAILGKLIQIPAVEVTVWRTAMAAVGLVIVASFRGTSLRVPLRAMWAFLGTGALIGWHWALFFLSARLATASVCLAAMPTVIIWSSMLEPFTNGTRRWNRLEFVTGIMMVGAVWIIYRAEFNHWLGFTVGLSSAFLAAIFAVANKPLTAKHSPVVICCYQMIGACLSCMAVLPIMGVRHLTMPDSWDVLWLLILSQVCTVGAYVGYLDVLRRLSVFTINVVYNLEPVYGILLAALVFGERERMSSGFYLGAGIIVITVLSMPWINRRLAKSI